MSRESTRGFSLIEMMIVLGLAAGAALMFAQLNTNAMRGQSTVKASADMNALAQSVQMLMGNATGCGANVPGNLSAGTFNTASPPASIAVNPLRYADGVVVATTTAPGNTYGTNLVLQSMVLTDFHSISANSYAATLRLTGASTNVKATPGASLLVRDIPVQIALDTSTTPATITGCGAGGGPLSLGSFQCTTLSNFANTSGNVTVSCSGTYPYPLTGGCNSPGRINTDYISGNTQICHQNGGSNPLTAYITCCK